MPVRLPVQKRTLGARLESEANKYTDNEVLTVNDYCHSIYNPTYSPEIEEYLRKLSRGDYSQDIAISGRRTSTVSFSVDPQPHATVNQAPMYFMLLRACGMRQTTHGATGVSLVPHAEEDRTPITIETVERQAGTTPKQLLVRHYGCMGNARLVGEQIGRPVRIDFEFQGAFSGVSTRSYANLITPASFDTALPEAILSATLNLYGTTQYPGSWALDFGNQLERYDDASKPGGVDGARIVGRDSRLEIDPDTFVTDDIDWYTDHIDNTTGQLSFVIGSNLTISAPAAQIADSYKPGDRQGHVTNQLRLGLKRSSGNDEFKILQGSE